MTRPRGFVALPGDAFGGEDNEAPRRSFRDLLWDEAFWIGWSAAAGLWTGLSALDAGGNGWLATAAIHGTATTVLAWCLGRAWRRWRRRA